LFVLVVKEVHMKKDDFLEEGQRAEDIILGSLGFGEDACIASIEATKEGYRGKGHYSDGEEFDFESDCELDDLDRWALSILLQIKEAVNA
jgi:hypothetical protein